MEIINDNVIFGLDIGTRSIVGIVGIKENDTFRVLASHVELHETRSMIDGQIHDIDRVAQTIVKVRDKLQKVTGKQLKKACIAAAGRVLKTMETHVTVEIEDSIEISKETVLSLELKGMEKAMHQVNYTDEGKDMPFYCVGYSVTNYYLNNFLMKNLLGHKGSVIAADVLSTFLPSEVVNSLYRVIEKAGLEVYSLTLEPIAAIEVAIPESYRLLNIALIDIGAGTSDIAITKGGSIIAYGMIPTAGDEITESIVHKYLVDFKTAETIKIKASGRAKTVTFKDAIGIKQSVNLDEVRETMSVSKNQLAKEIAKRIMELNGGHATNAVFIVGGGGQIKGFEELLSKELSLPKERVAIRGKDVLTQVISDDKSFKKNPEFVTPIGICLTGYNNNQHDFVEVFINDESMRVFNTKRLTVMDVVALKGIEPKSFIGRRGEPLHFELNGEERTIKGHIGEAAKIHVNQKDADLSSPIKMHDYITVISAIDGMKPSPSIKDVIGDNYIYINQDKKLLPYKIKVNNTVKNPLTNIVDGDVIKCDFPKISSLLKDFEVDYTHAFVNELEVDHDYRVKPSDKIITFIDKEELLMEPIPKKETHHEKVSAPSINVIVNKQMITMTSKKEYHFIDVFEYIDFDRQYAKGTIITTINNNRCTYMDKVEDGDVLEVYWNTNTK